MTRSACFAGGVALAADYNVVTPDTVPAADWQLRLQVQLMFPR